MRGDNLKFSFVMHKKLHDEAVVILSQSKMQERDWKQMVQEGRARLVTTKELNGYRQHYEMV